MPIPVSVGLFVLARLNLFFQGIRTNRGNMKLRSGISRYDRQVHGELTVGSE